MSGTVPIKDSLGDIRNVPPDVAERAIKSGAAKIPSAEEIRKDELGGLGGSLAALGEGAARGASLGLLDPAAIAAARAFGGDESAEAVRKHLAEVKDANPGLALTGEIGGTIAPLLLTGGAGAAAEGAEGASALVRGVRAAGALPRAVSAAGEGLSGAVRGILPAGEGLLGRAAARVLPSAIGAGAEGAGYGVGQEISENSLNGGDHELTAEQLIAAAGHGAMFGAAIGGAGGLLGALGSLGARKLSEGAEAIASAKFGEAGSGLGEKYVKASAALSNSDPATLRAMGVQNLSAEAREARRIAVFDAPDIKAQATRDIRRDVDQILESTRDLSAEAQGKLKESHVDAAIRKGPEALEEMKASAGEQLTQIREKLQMMREDPTGYGNQAQIKLAGQLIERMGDSAAEDSATKLFVDLDYLKRRIGKFAKPGQFLGADQATAQEFRNIYEELRTHLEQEPLWGKAAADQKVINAAWAKQIDTQQLFERRLSTELGRDPNNPWVRKMTADPEKISAYVKGLTSPEKDLIHSTIKEHVANSTRLAEAIRDSYELAPKKAAQVDSIKSSAASLRSTIEKAEKAITLSNQLEALGARTPSSWSITGTLSHVLGGAPEQSIRQLASVEKMLNLSKVQGAAMSVDAQLTSSIRGYLSRTAEALGRAERPAALKLAIGRSDRTLRQSYDKRVAEVRQMNDPAQASHRLASSLGSLAEHAPSVSMAVTAKATNIASYLASQIPAAMPSPSLLQAQLKGPPPSDSEMSKWLRVSAIAEKPQTALSEMKAGRLTSDQVQALKACWPKIYEKLQTTVMQQVAQRPTEIPYEKRKNLGILLNIPTDPTLEPDFIRALQSGYGPQHDDADMPKPAGRVGRAKLDNSKHTETDIERVASAG